MGTAVIWVIGLLLLGGLAWALWPRGLAGKERHAGKKNKEER